MPIPCSSLKTKMVITCKMKLIQTKQTYSQKDCTNKYVKTMESPMFSYHDLVDDPNTINLFFNSQFVACANQPYIL